MLLAIQRAAELAALAHIFPPASYAFPDAEILRGYDELLADPAVELYLAELDRATIGCVSVAGEYVRTLYVLPDAQGRGVGAALHDFALNRLRARGTTTAKLWVLEENHAARAFYERRGWLATGESRGARFPPYPREVEFAKPLERP